MKQALGGREKLPDDWESTAELAAIRRYLSFGQRKEQEQTWWWNEVQGSI